LISWTCWNIPVFIFIFFREHWIKGSVEYVPSCTIFTQHRVGRIKLGQELSLNHVEGLHPTFSRG
jgi:hypothetical protein